MKKGPQHDSYILSTEIQNAWNYSPLCVCFNMVFRCRNNYMYIVTIGFFKQQYKTLITIGFIAVRRLLSSMWILQTALQIRTYCYKKRVCKKLFTYSKKTQRSSVTYLASNLVSSTQKPTELAQRIMHISGIYRKVHILKEFIRKLFIKYSSNN